MSTLSCSFIQSRRAFRILKKICGENCIRDVVLIPTKWDQSADEEQDVASNRALWEVDIDRNDMLMAGARIKRCPSSKESALAIISSCIENSRVVRFQIQREVVDQGCELVTTTVGRQLRVDLVRRQDELRQERHGLIAKGPPEGMATMGAEREETKAIDRRLEENTRLTRRIEKAVSSLHTQERGLELRVLGSSQPRPPVSRLPPMLGSVSLLELAEYTRYSQQSQHRVHDPLSQAVATGSLSFLQMIVERDFAKIATGSWEWLTELEQLGYNKNEVAELLLEQRNDQPWIVFAPWILEDRSPRTNFHVTGCVHDGGCHSPAISLEVNPCPADAAQNLRRATASLCGLGGVIPSSQEKDWWKALVKFPDSSSAVIHYQSLATDVTVLTRYLATAMRRISTALNIVQDAKACCNRFTVLLQKPRSEVITMRTINFSDVVYFSQVLEEIKKGHYAASLTRCLDTARTVLDDLGMPLENPGGSNVFNVLHECALAIQFLSLGLVSYLQAHVGKLELFLLEEKLADIKLLGSTSYSSSQVYISAALHRFTCLDDMTNTPVLVFTRTSTRHADSSPQLDLLAKPEDLLDTWGPGEMIRKSEDGETRFRALTVRGGIIHRSSGTTFHWKRLESYASAIDEESFAMNEPIRIGAALHVDASCTKHEQYWIQLCQIHTRPLGTTPTRMRQQGLEYGAQGGQFGLATFNLVLEKVPGVSLKDVMLERLRIGQDFASFLAAPFGLQVSFCSGLARRVRIRDMLAELLPVYVNRTMSSSEHWSTVKKKYNIVSVLSSDGTKVLTKCLRRMHKLDHACFQYLWALTFELVSSMKSTGFDIADVTFAVAIIPSAPEEPLNRVVFSASGPNYWTRALRDTDTCATFAYFTLSCLQVDGKGCRRTESCWHRRVLLLETEVLRNTSGHRPRDVSEPWNLADGESYRLGSPDADAQFGILVHVVRPQPNECPRLVVRKSLTPLWVWKRFAQKRHLHLQERQGPSDSVLPALMTSAEDTALDFS